MFILNPIIGVIAVSFFSIIVLPVALVIFSRIAGMVAMVGPRKKFKRSQKLQILTVAEQA